MRMFAEMVKIESCPWPPLLPSFPSFICVLLILLSFGAFAFRRRTVFRRRA